MENENNENQLVIHVDSEFSNFLDTGRFNHLWRVANTFAASDFIPDTYKGKPENCMVALQMSMRLGVDPMMFMQKTYIIHGKPAMEATLVIALVNSSGLFKGPIQYKYEGEGMKRECTAFAESIKLGAVLEQTVSMETAKVEGWLEKKGSKWKTLPDLMLQYRSASFFAKVYAPECLMGMQTVEEMQDTKRTTKDVTPSKQAKDITPEQAFQEEKIIEHQEQKEEVKELTPLEDATNKLIGLYHLGFDTKDHNEHIKLAKSDNDHETLFGIIDAILDGMPKPEFDFTLAKAVLMDAAKKQNNEKAIKAIKEAESRKDLGEVKLIFDQHHG